MKDQSRGRQRQQGENFKDTPGKSGQSSSPEDGLR